jgi:hypothetical protein
MNAREIKPRWTIEQLDELKRELGSRHLLDPIYRQCADAIGSLQFDLIDAAEHGRALVADYVETIEEMAQAIHADIMENAARDLTAMKPLAWQALTPKTQDDYRKTACAALAALRKKALG